MGSDADGTDHGEAQLKPDTLVARAGEPDGATGAVIPPIHLSTTFARDDNYALINSAHGYIRDQNPSFLPVERLLMQLEGGTDALVFSSGMAAAMTVVQSLKPGDHILVPNVMYWSLRNWLESYCATWGLSLTRFDARAPAAVSEQLRTALSADHPAECTQLVWLESPTNPTWDVIDLREACTIAHEYGALVGVDSTVATPVLTRPIELGADIVMHSATKYLNGHSDVIAGALITAQDNGRWQQIRKVRSENGAILGAFEAWLLQRGMRTLFLRVRAASASALTIARHFEGHTKLTGVLYPGLRSNPGHRIATQQMHGGYGGMLSLMVRGGAAAALQAVGRCKLFVRATSLGGVESLVEHRYSIEGPDSPIPPELIRVSIGIEDTNDLIADLEQALE